jgi:hypothetical protein
MRKTEAGMLLSSARGLDLPTLRCSVVSPYDRQQQEAYENRSGAWSREYASHGSGLNALRYNAIGFTLLDKHARSY